MEASRETHPRVVRLTDALDEIELETAGLLSRLEAQAEQIGELRAKVDSLERVARGERDARRRLADTLKRERKAAEAVHARAETAEAALAEQAQEVGRLEQALSESEQYKHLIWSQLAETQAELALKSRPLWRKLLRRPPAG